MGYKDMPGYEQKAFDNKNTPEKAQPNPNDRTWIGRRSISRQPSLLCQQAVEGGKISPELAQAQLACGQMEGETRRTTIKVPDPITGQGPEGRYRTQVDVVQILSDRSGPQVVTAVVPGWNPDLRVKFAAEVVAQDLIGHLRAGTLFSAVVKLNAATSAQLNPTDFELAPPPIKDPFVTTP